MPFIYISYDQMTMCMMDLEMIEFIEQMPKVELHAHLSGSVSAATVQRLVVKKQERQPDWGRNGGWEVCIRKGELRTLQENFQMFALLHQLSDNEEVAYMMTANVIKEFAAENVKYLELRTTPRCVEATGMTKRSYIEHVLRAIQDCQADTQLDIVVRLLLSIDRRTTLHDAADTVALADEFAASTQGLVVGVDLSGDPTKADARMFIPILQKARHKGLKITLHVAEVPGQYDETLALLSIAPDRIGHGTFLHPDVGGSQDLVQLVQQHHIPVEFCLTSNVCTNSVSSYDSHQFAYWYQYGHPCLVCTDDKGVYSTSLSEEFRHAARTFSLTKQQIWKLSEDSIDHIFADSLQKDQLKAKWKSAHAETFSMFNTGT